jgi:hypothetical protein
VFDGGVAGPDAEIKIQVEELDDHRFVDATELSAYVPPFIEARVRAALEARGTGCTVYLPAGSQWPAG